MSWARLDDEILDNSKVAQAGVIGWALYVAGIVYCARNLTDGVIPRSRVTALLDLSGVFVVSGNWGGECFREDVAAALDKPDPHDVAEHLVEVGLWEKGSGGYLVHDYLDFNPSREQVEREREGSRNRASRFRSRKREAKANAVTPTVTNGAGADAPVPVPLKDKRSVRDVSSIPKNGQRPEVVALCQLLADQVAANGSKRPDPKQKGWLDAARLLLDRDQRPAREVERLIRWCQADEFWRGNVLSMPTFRKQYDKLRLQAGRGTSQPRSEDRERKPGRRGRFTNIQNA